MLFRVGQSAAAVVPALKEAKKSAKNVTVKEKLALWRSVVEKRGIKLSRSVKGQSVLVIDDLYQSGASLWSFAKYLKNLGATTVVGLACVKSLRDKDNK
jgi:predicted amidophosphoribosyltransferase